VPFLLAIVTLIAAIILRYNMPESQEVSLTAISDRRWLDKTTTGSQCSGVQVI
jgi:hypothetical protein